jgi:hypothetical protein
VLPQNALDPLEGALLPLLTEGSFSSAWLMELPSEGLELEMQRMTFSSLIDEVGVVPRPLFVLIQGESISPSLAESTLRAFPIFRAGDLDGAMEQVLRYLQLPT